ncbi:hypothetical protein [Tautonia plasticadhaerens]|uniref:Lipoprotein n=1 Tax=Tautonia plasticadhaerens TaxID=2527974 RepID=A0A518HB11_9BACT|nr:hypothetical protein [Tautonia plasticadhaerens]QDV38011.1 hypothetical protein ElP_59590 [Tautonia plasticadhaerens]
MRRLPALAALCALSIAPLGCGFASYEARLQATERRIKDEMTINATLAGPMQGAFAENDIYFRAPQGLEQVGQFQLIPLNPGFFEAENSFITPGAGDQLSTGPYQVHALARRDSQEPEQGQEQPEQPPVPRGDFRADVLDVLKVVYGDEVTSAPLEQVSKTIWPRSEPARSLSFERATLTDRNQQLIHIYFYTEESGDATYNAALIWEFPGGEPPTSGANPVDLTLGTFAVGQRAIARFSGRPDSPGGGGTGDAGASAIAF